jgi:hypothetical protein
VPYLSSILYNSQCFFRYLALGIVGEHTIDSPMVSWEDPFMPYDVDNLGITALQVSEIII